MIYENQAQLDEALAYWQKVLRVQDWTVTAKIERSRDMWGDSRGGEIRINHNRKAARVQLLDPSDYAETCWEPHDMEYFLVHELCHLHTTVIRENDQEEVASVQEEQAVDAFAWALVGLKRQIPTETDAFNICISSAPVPGQLLEVIRDESRKLEPLTATNGKKEPVLP